MLLYEEENEDKRVYQKIKIMREKERCYEKVLGDGWTET